MEVISQSGSARPISVPNDKSGVNMDRAIEKKKLPLKNVAVVAALMAIAALLAWYLLGMAGGRSLVIENSRVVISPVISLHAVQLTFNIMQTDQSLGG